MIYGFDIYSFVELCADDSENCAIYDSREEREVFCGTLRDAQFSDFTDYEIQSIELRSWDVHHDINKPVIVFNIETDEDEDEEGGEDE